MPDKMEEQTVRVYQRIREILTEARERAWQAVNTEMVACYWHIGRLLVEEEQSGEALATGSTSSKLYPRR